MRGPSGPLSCTCMRMHARVRVYVCVRAHECVCARTYVFVQIFVCARAHVRTFVRALRTCVRMYAVVYVHALCACACVCVRACTCVCACTCACMRMWRDWRCPSSWCPSSLREGQPPSCMSTLGSLGGGLGGFPGLAVMLQVVNYPNASFARPLQLSYLNCSWHSARGWKTFAVRGDISTVYVVFGREITKYTVKYGVPAQFWPALIVQFHHVYAQCWIWGGAFVRCWTSKTCWAIRESLPW